ncbi:hypothetical protein J4440_01015 [Candidatus Woesearchaeota archaeon]|nr:hypothetical protein [Candidatus Woesearchaeota archaeon]
MLNRLNKEEITERINHLPEPKTVEGLINGCCEIAEIGYLGDSEGRMFDMRKRKLVYVAGKKGDGFYFSNQKEFHMKKGAEYIYSREINIALLSYYETVKKLDE